MKIVTVFTVCFHYSSPCGCDYGVGVRDVYLFRSDARGNCPEGDFVSERQALEVGGKLFLLDENLQEFELSKTKEHSFVPEDKAKDRGVEI